MSVHLRVYAELNDFVKPDEQYTVLRQARLNATVAAIRSELNRPGAPPALRTRGGPRTA